MYKGYHEHKYIMIDMINILIGICIGIYIENVPRYYIIYINEASYNIYIERVVSF